MQLLGFIPAAAWIATIYQAIEVTAYPSYNNVQLAAEDHDHHQLESRAPSPISLYKREGHNTWTGYQSLPGLFGAAVSDQAVRDMAISTYNSVKNLNTLVSVIHVPGGGWAAGTVWLGSDEGFRQFARSADVFWNVVPVPDQQLNADLNGKSTWHAEAVAAVVVEEEFENEMVEAIWPTGTKIYTYGQFWDNGRIVVGPKPVCTDGHSQVVISCAAWLQRLGISAVAVL